MHLSSPLSLTKIFINFISNVQVKVEFNFTFEFFLSFFSVSFDKMLSNALCDAIPFNTTSVLFSESLPFIVKSYDVFSLFG